MQEQVGRLTAGDRRGQPRDQLVALGDLDQVDVDVASCEASNASATCPKACVSSGSPDTITETPRVCSPLGTGSSARGCASPRAAERRHAHRDPSNPSGRAHRDSFESSARRTGGACTNGEHEHDRRARDDRGGEHERLVGGFSVDKRPHAQRQREPSLVVDVDQRIEEVPPAMTNAEGATAAAVVRRSMRHRHAPPGGERREPAFPGQVEQSSGNREYDQAYKQHEQRRHPEQGRRHQGDQRVSQPQPSEHRHPPDEQRGGRDHQHHDADPDKEHPRRRRKPRDREPVPTTPPR